MADPLTDILVQRMPAGGAPDLAQSLVEGAASPPRTYAGLSREQYIAKYGVDPEAGFLDRTGQALRMFGQEAAPTAAAAAMGPAAGLVKAVAPAARVAAEAYPKTAGALEGLLTGLSYKGAEAALSSDAAQAQGLPTDIRERQEFLRQEGYYQGNPDGQRGPETKKAEERWLADAPARAERERARQEMEMQRSAQSIEGDKARAAATAAEAQKQEAEARKVDAERKARMDEEARKRASEVSWMRRAFQDYGPLVATLGGFTLGGLARGKVVQRYDEGRNAAKEAADALTARIPPNTAITPKNIDQRAGRVNEFWAGGQSPLKGSPEVPFKTEPGANPVWQSNPAAPGAETLYQHNRLRNVLADTGMLGVGALDYGLASYGASRFKNIADQARQDSQVNDTQANRDRIDRFDLLTEIAEAAKGLGQGFGGGYLGATFAHHRGGARPGTGRAEGERARIEKHLADPKMPPEPPPPSPAAPPSMTAAPPADVGKTRKQAEKEFKKLTKRGGAAGVVGVAAGVDHHIHTQNRDPETGQLLPGRKPETSEDLIGALVGP